MKKILRFILRLIARLILRKYKPQVVGITGSVGKTSTKEAIFAVLSYEYNVRRNIKSYNNEIGLPLTIIGVETGGKNIFKWFRVFAKAFQLLISRDKTYPEILVLEMGADKVGDLDYLLGVAQPDKSVLTAVTETHLQAHDTKDQSLWFKDLKGVLKEKQKIVTCLNKEGWAILNQDDENVISLRDKVKGRILSYGFSSGAHLQASEILFTGLEQDFCETQYQWDCKVWGANFKITYNGSTMPIFLPHCFGKAHVSAALAASGVGLAFGMNLLDISDALREYKPEKGRMNLVAGIKYSLLIDDTYNASPHATKVALEVLGSISLSAGKRKIAVLSDMLELGERSAEAHREVGFKVAEAEIDYLITVGQEARNIAQSAIEAGFNLNHVQSFEETKKAGIFLQNLLQEGDLILVKGSQKMRMEKIIKEVMAEPDRAAELLVRQTGEWENK